MDQHFYFEQEPPVKLAEPIQGKRRYTDVLCFPLFLGYLVRLGCFLSVWCPFDKEILTELHVCWTELGIYVDSKMFSKMEQMGQILHTGNLFTGWIRMIFWWTQIFLLTKVCVLKTAPKMFRDYIIDIMNGWAILLCCGTMAGLCFTLIWIGALRSYAKVVIWNSLVLVNVAAFVFTIFCYLKAGVFKFEGVAIGQDLAGKLKDAPSGLDIGAVTGRSSFQWYGIVMSAVLVALVLSTVAILRGLKKWIEEAVLCMGVCGEAIDAIQPIQVTQSVVYTQSQDKPNLRQPQLTTTYSPQAAYQAGNEIQAPKFMAQVVQPIKPGPIDLLWERLIAPLLHPLLLITFPILCFTTACWLSVLLFIISMCNIQQQGNGAFGFVWTWKFYVMVIYHSLGLIWVWQVINGFNLMVVAGSVSYYYWHRYTVFAPVRQVLVTALRYNCGSVIFGGLFFSPALLLFRNICKYINRVLECFQQCGRRVPEHLTGSVNRSLSCIDNIISYFNKDALILVAIKGKDYSASACLARERVKANAALMFSASPDGLLLAGKLLVSFTCAICSLAMSQLPVYSDMLSSVYIASPIFLTLMTSVISYAIAHTLLQVYTTTWRTLLLNLWEDCERYHGKPRFCPQSLMDTVQKVMELRANAELGSKLNENDDIDDRRGFSHE